MQTSLQTLKSVGLFMCLSTFLNQAANKRSFPTCLAKDEAEMKQGSSQHILICLNSSHLALALIILASPTHCPHVGNLAKFCSSLTQVVMY